MKPSWGCDVFAFPILNLTHLIKSYRQTIWQALSYARDVFNYVQYDVHYLFAEKMKPPPAPLTPSGLSDRCQDALGQPLVIRCENGWGWVHRVRGQRSF